MELSRMFRFRKIDSPQRKGLRVAVYEGLPAVIVMNILSGPFLTGYMLYLGATSEQIGIVLAIPALANLMQVVAAVYMQKLENRKLAFIIFGSLHRIISASTGLIPFLFPENLWVIMYILIYGVAFMCNSAGAVIWSTIISDMVPSQVRGRYFGIRNTIHGAIGSLFLFVGGQILEKNPGGAGFQILYMICVVCVVVNIIFFCLYPNPKFVKSQESNPGSMMLKPFRDRMFLRAMLFLSVWVLLQGVALPFFSYVMLDILKISYKWVSIVTIIQTMLSMVGFFIWGNLNVRYSNRTLLFWTLPIIAMSCLLWGAMAVLPVLLVLVVVHMLLGFGVGGFNQLVFNFVIGDTPRADRPMFIAVFSAVTGVAGFLGPMLGGVVFNRLKDAAEWVIGYGVFSISGILLLLLAFTVGPFVLKEPVARED